VWRADRERRRCACAPLCSLRRRHDHLRILQRDQPAAIAFNSIQSIDQPRPIVPFRLGARVLAQPVAADGLIAVPLDDGSVSIVSELHCIQAGRVRVGAPVAVTPALRNGFLFVGAGRKASCFDLAAFMDHPSRMDLKPVWTFECAGSEIIQPVLADDGSVYLMSRDGSEAILEATGQTDGERAWAQPLRFSTSQTAPPLFVRGRLVVITLAGEVSVIEPETGQVVESFPLGRRVAPQVPPCVVGSRALVADSEGNLIQLLLTESGPLITTIYNHGSRIASLAASEEFIAIGHMSGLTLLNSRGHLLWSSDGTEAVSVAPIIAGKSVFAVDDSGTGLLFNSLRATPAGRVKLLSGEISLPPLMTRSRIAAVNGSGDVVTIAWS
jgi:outer membrane protein assembly factor BamB